MTTAQRKPPDGVRTAACCPRVGGSVVAIGGAWDELRLHNDRQQCLRSEIAFERQRWHENAARLLERLCRDWNSTCIPLVLDQVDDEPVDTRFGCHVRDNEGNRVSDVWNSGQVAGDRQRTCARLPVALRRVWAKLRGLSICNRNCSSNRGSKAPVDGILPSLVALAFGDASAGIERSLKFALALGDTPTYLLPA